MKQNRYLKPVVQTMTGEQLLESLGPVSCGSATDQFGPGQLGHSDPTQPVGVAPGGCKRL